MDLTHGRLHSIPDVVCRLKCVQVLTLRQNLIPDMSPLAGLETLTELDLYDNELRKIEGLEEMKNLMYEGGSEGGMEGVSEEGGRERSKEERRE